MKKLRWLSVVMYLGDDRDKHTEGPSFLSNELRYLYWERYPASPFPDSFQLMKLVVLKLHYSLQKELWNGCKCLPHLKVLQLCFMSNLLSTPDFDGLPCLETLELRYCDKLKDIHSSISNRRSLEYRLPHLKMLQLCYMENLLNTPDFNGLPYLQKLEISNCDKLEEIHLSLGYHTSLDYVGVRSCKKLRMFPTIVQMKNLKTLDIENCNWILPSSVAERYTLLEKVFHQFTRKMNPSSLQKLDLSGWGLKDGEIPSNIGELPNLEELHLSRNDFSRLGFSLLQLTRLKILILSECKRLVELPELPSSIAVLEADYCESLTTIGNNFHTKFQCFCEVSFLRNSPGIVNDAGRLVESMLQGMGIPKVWSTKYTLKLPENWCNDFCGFMMCFPTNDSTLMSYTIRMFNVVRATPSFGRKYDASLEKESIGGGRTWVGFVSFASLSHTSWWQETHNTRLVSFFNGSSDGEFEVALVPKKSGIAPTDFLAFQRLNIVNYSTLLLTIEISFRSHDKSGKYVSDTMIKPKSIEA